MDQELKKFRAAAVQMAPVLFNRDATVEKVITNIENCAKEGARLAVFPETIIPNYPYYSLFTPPSLSSQYFMRLMDQSVEVPGPITETIGTAAKNAEMVVVIGVNERDGGSIYNTQLIFDSDGSLAGKRRKIMPTYAERMVWGMGDGSGLRTFETAVGKIGALICWEHFMPLARYTMMAKGEQIHCSHFPGSLYGEGMANQIDAAIRHHAMESGAFVVNSTGWLTPKQQKEIIEDDLLRKKIAGGNCTAIVAPNGKYLAGPLPDGEGIAVAEIDLNYITLQKSFLDTCGHYARPDIFELFVNTEPRNIITEPTDRSIPSVESETRDRLNDIPDK